MLELGLEPELVPKHTKSLHMLDMLSESSEEKIPVEALVELEIQVVLEVLVVVGDYGVLKQFSQHSNSYEDDPALVVMVVVDPFYKREYLINNI